MKTYFSKDNNYEDINSGFKQTFHHTPSKKVDVSSIIRKKIESDEQISDLDLEILKKLNMMKFATCSLIARAVDESEEKIEKRLIKLVRNKIINNFLLSSIKFISREETPKDAQYIYTMDYAGSEIINTFVKSNFDEWQCKDAALNPIAIAKILIANEFYIKVNKNIGSRLKSYVVMPEYPIDRYMLTSDFELIVKKEEDENRVFLCEVINDSYDRYNIIKTIERLENFIQTEGYTKVYRNVTTEPVFIFICPNEDVIEDVTSIVENLFTKIKYYRLTTYERLKGEIDAPETFLKFDRTSGGIKASGIKIFKKIN